MEPITVAPGDEAAAYIQQNAMAVVSEAIDRLLMDMPHVGTEVAAFESHLRAMNPKRKYRERVLTLPKLPPPKPKKALNGNVHRTSSQLKDGTSPPDTAETKGGLVSPRAPSSTSITPPAESPPPGLPSFFLPTKSSKNSFSVVATEIPNDIAAGFGTPRKAIIKSFPNQFTLKFTAVESGKGGASASVQLQRRQEQEALKRMGLDTEAFGAQDRHSSTSNALESTSFQVLHKPAPTLNADKAPAIVLGDTDLHRSTSMQRASISADFLNLNGASVLSSSESLLDRCKELPIFIGDFPWNGEQLDLMIKQLTQIHEMRHITFVVATTPSVAVRLDDGYMYRADVDTPLWNLAARQLVEDIITAQYESRTENAESTEGQHMTAATAALKAQEVLEAAAAAEADKKNTLSLSPQGFGEHLHNERAAAEKAADILLDMGIDPKILGDAEYEELDRARRVENARRRSDAKGGTSKFRSLVHGVMESRKRTREQLSQKMRVPKSKAETLLGGESINANSLLHAIDDEKLENALIKFLFPSHKPAGNGKATRDSIMSSLNRTIDNNRSIKFSQMSPVRQQRRSVSYSDSGSSNPSPDSKAISNAKRTSDSRSNSITSLTLSPTTNGRDLVGEGSGLGRRVSNPFSASLSATGLPTTTGGTSHHVLSPTSITLKSRVSTTFMAQALKRSKSFGLAETALRAARERKSETEVRAATSVSSSLMVLRDACREYVHHNKESQAVFHYHRIFHSSTTPMSQRATDKLYDILARIPKEHDSCVVILGFNQSVLLRHIATISSIYFKIVREVQSVNHAYTLYDVQERLNPHIDVDAHRRRVQKGRSERDQRRTAITEQIRPKIRALEQVESPAECRERLKKAAKDRQERLERRHRVDEALDQVDFSQQYRAAVKIQSMIRGFMARRRVEALLDPSNGTQDAYVSPAQLLYKEFREGKSLFIRSCVSYLVDALGAEMVAEKAPSRSFYRTVVLNTRRRQRVPPTNEDDISSEDEQWISSQVRHIVPGATCALNPVANVIAALQAAGSDDVSYLIEVISEYGHVEPMQRKASSVLEKLVMYIMFAAFAAMRIKLDYGYAATPGSYASSVFLQIPTRFQPISSFSDWMTALPLPMEWARQMSILSHANSHNPLPLLSHRMLLGGPLPNGAWIADEPSEENPAVAAATAKAAKDAEKTLHDHHTTNTAMLRNASMFLGPSQSFRGLPSVKRATMQPNREAVTPTTGPRKEDYVIMCPRRVEKFDKELDPAISAPMFLVPECLTDVQWEETVQGILSGEALSSDIGSSIFQRGYNRVVWISTCPHPCILVNGAPMYVPERKSIHQRHCINNPMVKDSRSSANDLPDTFCANTSLVSYCPPTSVPEPRVVRSPRTVMTGKRGNRSLLMLSETPLVALGVTKSDLTHALPPRHLTTLRDEVNNQISPPQKSQYIYLAEIEAALINDLIEQLAFTNGVIEYHPAASINSLTMFKPYWEIPIEDGQKYQHIRVSAKERDKGTLDELVQLIGELGYDMIWGPSKGGSLPNLRTATLGVEETTIHFGLRKPPATRLRIALPAPSGPSPDLNTVLAKDTAERLAAPGILKAIPGKHIANNNAVAAAAAVAIGGTPLAGGHNALVAASPAANGTAPLPSDSLNVPNRNLLALPRRSRKGGKQGNSPSADPLQLTESAAVSVNLGTGVGSCGGTLTQPAGTTRSSVQSTSIRLPKSAAEALTSLPAVAERIRTSLRRNPDADRDSIAFKYHRVPLKYGHITELATCLSDIYEFVVSNSDEPRTAFVFSVSDPVRSIVCSTAATVIYELDLRKSYLRSELTDLSQPPPSTAHLNTSGQTKKTGFITPSQTALDPSRHKSKALGSNNKEIAPPSQPPQLAKRAPSNKPSAISMFPFLSRVSEENIGIELERACTTLDEIAVGCGVYDLLIGDAARTVMYAILCQLPDEESLAPPLKPELDTSAIKAETDVAEDGTPVPVHVSIRRRREAELLKQEAEEEERQRKKALLMSLPQLRFTRRTLTEWLEGLKPAGWINVDPNEGSSIVYAHHLYSAVSGGGVPPTFMPKQPVDNAAALSCPYGPILSLEEASRRFEQYFTLALFTSFVRLSCDARRINAATGKLLPRFEDHVLGTSQLVESIKQGVNMWESPTQASDGINEFDANGLHSARGKRRTEKDKRDMSLTPTVLAATAAAAAAAIEGTSVTNACVEDDPHSRNNKRPQNQEDMIYLTPIAITPAVQSPTKLRGRSLGPQQGNAAMASVNSFASTARGRSVTTNTHHSASQDIGTLALLDDSGLEPYEEPVHPLSTAAAALARPFTVFDAEYEGIRIWKSCQGAMHVLR